MVWRNLCTVLSSILDSDAGLHVSAHRTVLMHRCVDDCWQQNRAEASAALELAEQERRGAEDARRIAEKEQADVDAAKAEVDATAAQQTNAQQKLEEAVARKAMSQAETV